MENLSTPSGRPATHPEQIEAMQRERRAAIRRADALAWAMPPPTETEEQIRREYEQEMAQ